MEASVWNGRMLTALEKGVKGGLWFSLIDKVYNRQNLYNAWSKVARNKGSAGIDGITIEAYQRDAEANLTYLMQRLKTGDYQPKAVRRVEIPKGDGKMRPLGIPTVADRIVQGAIRHVIEPIFEQQFAQHSYGFRPGRGCKDALRRVDQLLKSGYEYVVDADLKSYFDTIPHDRLMQEMQKSISDEVAGHDTGQNPTHPWASTGGLHRIDQPGAAWLVRILPAQLPNDVPDNRFVDTHAIAKHTAKATRRLRTRSGPRSSALAKCLLQGHGLIFTCASPSSGV